MTEQGGVKTGYRVCLAAALLSVLAPGAGHLAIKARWKALSIAAAVLNIAAFVTVIVIVAPVRSRRDLADVIGNRSVFIALGISLLVLAITRLWAILDSAWIARPVNVAMPEGETSAPTVSRVTQIAAVFTTAVIVVAAVAPLTVAANYVWQTDRMIEKVFASHDATTANPTPIATSDTIDPSTTAPPFPGVDRVNVLLIGGDAGQGRPGLRTDSMIVVSVDPTTGDTAMISVPRNLPALPFPPGTAMAERFPNGFDNIANAVYGYADKHRDLMGGVADAGAQAIKSGIAQLLGIPINYYVLVDMGGFRDVVDALGGIDIYVTQRIPTPGNPQGSDYHEVPEYIEVGQQHMDGTLALAYSRSRESDSDYHRMGRQRCMLAAIATAATPKSLALGLTDLVSAFGAAVRTDIPRSKLGDFAQLIDRFSKAGGTDAVRTLHLAPPTLDTNRWRAKQVRDLVAATLSPTFTGPINLPPALLDEQCRASK
ncbi:MAG: hypothetical protein F2681_10305 [Actinobacteria bacterium]|uniref:Unannotated protein n=1 Tax=freshwater metagenome TaxID=449393 RepID=A0A6J7BUU5_9ZZZZ|nr:hypothetical protein [Actinomycetota bacterium]MSW78275.1 hypothetical protein [Actinomycetota bacterium]MSX54612.1 hypothetical protein [Actinomycetota bacterium]MSX94287.1 hypothetical protein [Actinomycetota bacterium]MSZ83521.1 hypothetical protein [Actinomycetota bacterium]